MDYPDQVYSVARSSTDRDISHGTYTEIGDRHGYGYGYRMHDRDADLRGLQRNKATIAPPSQENLKPISSHPLRQEAVGKEERGVTEGVTKEKSFWKKILCGRCGRCG